MDLATIIGLLAGTGLILLGNILEGGHTGSLMQLTAFMIVTGGTLGAVMVGAPMSPPGEELLLGTDYLGRDVLAGIIHGASVTLAIGFSATAVSVIIGITIGVLAGYYGGWVDNLLMRFTEFFQVLPDLLFAMVLVALFSPNIYLIVFAVVATIVLHRSVLGRYIFATGRNELATKYSGVNTGMVIAIAYLIAGFCTAFAAIPFCIYTGSVQPATHGAFFELYAIAAAVLGGCSLRGGEGSIPGILIGTTILIVLRNMVNLMGYPTPLSDAITGGVIFIGVLVDQHGATGFKRLFKRKPKAA